MVLNFGMQENCMKASDHFREVAKMDELGSGAKGKIINADQWEDKNE